MINIQEYKEFVQEDCEKPIPERMWEAHGEKLFGLHKKLQELCAIRPFPPEIIEVSEEYTKELDEFFLRMESLI